MEKQLLIIEVSQKQAYIFSSDDLEECQRRSQEIAHVTSEAYFHHACPQFYDPAVNKVYTGGGHAVLQFPDKSAADSFARTFTLQALKDYPQMELFVRQHGYCGTLSPGENLLALSKALEEKKALRASSFHMEALGLEDTSRRRKKQKLFSRFARFLQASSMLAIVHIDGNAMGARVAKVYEESGTNWDLCVLNLQRFSDGIDSDFSAAYKAMTQQLRNWLRCETDSALPLHKIIAAGDDVCFVVSATYALECAASFLRHLSKRKNPADGTHYSACAGIAIIGKDADFQQGYGLSEALCANAKRFAAQYGTDVSALDFQIIDGIPKNSLQEIRADYRAEDGSYLLLRPIAVTGSVPEKHSYTYLTSMLGNMQEARNGFALKSLLQNQQPFHQGIQEVRLALHMDRAQPSVNRMLHGDPNNNTMYFTDDNGDSRCLFFDALELAPFTALWKGDPDEQNLPEN